MALAGTKSSKAGLFPPAQCVTGPRAMGLGVHSGQCEGCMLPTVA